MEVHLVFDDPNGLDEYPKYIERYYRDGQCTDNH